MMQQLKEENADLRRQLHEKTSLLKKPRRARPKKTERGVVSLEGGYRCAMKRNMGHAGADALLSHIDGDISRHVLIPF